MDALVLVLRGIVPPVVVASVLLVPAWARGRGTRTPRAWPLPVALGLGTVAGHVALNGWPPLALDVELKHGLFWVALLGAAAGALESTRSRFLPAARLALALGLPVYLLDFMRAHHWGPLEGWAWTAGLGLLVWLLGCGLERLARRRDGVELLPAWLVLLALAAGCLHVSGSMSLGQLAGSVCCVLGVGSVLVLLGPHLSVDQGTSTPLGLLLAGLLLGGLFASELGAVPALLLAAGAPTAPFVPRSWGATRTRRLLVALLAAALLGVAALGLELAALEPDPYAGF
jgi:hypothetical protein